MMKVGVALIAALVTVGAASGSTGQPISWTKPDMTAAVKALGYPKPHPHKLTCKGLGAAVNGRYASFRCTATYRRRRAFYAAGRGEGGWICAGSKLTACKLLRHGFLAKDAIPAGFTLDAMVSVSATGYAENKYAVVTTQRGAGCNQTGTLTWTCPFTAPAATVTISYRPVKGGWLVSGSG